jgi:hypothetical protein
MVEYGNGVSQGAGQVSGGSGGGGGGSLDVGREVGNWVSSAAHTIQTMPPAELLFIAVVLVLGLFVVKRVLL